MPVSDGIGHVEASELGTKVLPQLQAGLAECGWQSLGRSFAWEMSPGYLNHADHFPLS